MLLKSKFDGSSAPNNSVYNSSSLGIYSSLFISPFRKLELLFISIFPKSILFAACLFSIKSVANSSWVVSGESNKQKAYFQKYCRQSVLNNLFLIVC